MRLPRRQRFFQIEVHPLAAQRCAGRRELYRREHARIQMREPDVDTALALLFLGFGA
ncbi:hypothetical protein [Paraburkholderia azotifigens]|uniref:Uncharacterized protein n=1 Tax=Paraburkholderia azotifigens TaxID=2057004 RepID=A0ABU9R727_9BURK|nr:hypothetical protein [Paraburkholderia azotifigens]